jgi:hypothetical protein
MCMYVQVYVCICMYRYMYVYVCTGICMYMYVQVYVCICMYRYMYVYVCTCARASHTYILTYVIHTRNDTHRWREAIATAVTEIQRICTFGLSEDEISHAFETVRVTFEQVVCMYVCVYVCMYVCVYVCMYVYV